MNHEVKNYLISVSGILSEIKKYENQLEEELKTLINESIEEVDFNIMLVSELLEIFDFREIKEKN